MSETHPNLVAWLDGELPPSDAAVVACHVESCESCRRQCAALRDASTAVELYAEAVFAAANAKPKFSRWVPAFAALAAVAALAIFLAPPRQQTPVPAPATAPIVAAIPSRAPSPEPSAPAASKPVHRRRPVPIAPRRPAPRWLSADTAVEIAIPADAVFAPGALPEGMRLFGEMHLSPDGSLREIRLQQ